MRFLVDECTGPAVSRWLRDRGHDVFCVFEQARGINDDEVIERGVSEERIILTVDKDFGEKVFREGRLHSGIVLMRLREDSVSGKIAAMQTLLKSHASRIEGSFIVVTDKQVRFARL